MQAVQRADDTGGMPPKKAAYRLFLWPFLRCRSAALAFGGFTRLICRLQFLFAQILILWYGLERCFLQKQWMRRNHLM